MPSYNDIDGAPVTGSKELLTDLLRGEYGFTGLVISDLAAVGPGPATLSVRQIGDRAVSHPAELELTLSQEIP